MKQSTTPSANHYDAFISYRHLHPDEQVAAQVQSLLENYRPPKGVPGRRRIERVFLDRTELPTSGDLGKSLRDALLSASYLIVILSEHTQESRWCMEEIRVFKAAHGGRIDHILPVLVSGEPDDAIPELLRIEDVPGAEPVEPLCCDVRADNDRLRRRKAKTEFLRLAAPILGCGYDDLFRRHQRRQRKRRAGALGAAFSLMALIIAVIGLSFLRVQASEARYRENLMRSYVSEGARLSVQEDAEQALAYYTTVLAQDPENRLATAGALVELQRQDWLCAADDVPVDDVPVDDVPVDDVPASDPGRPPEWLFALGEPTQTPDDMQRGWVFPSEDAVRVWMPEDNTVYALPPVPEEYRELLPNAAVEVMPMFGSEYRRFVQYVDGAVALYEPTDQSDAQGAVTCALVRAFSYSEWGLGGFVFSNDTRTIFASPETGLLVINDSGDIGVFDARQGKYKGNWDLNKWIADIAFRSDGKGFAIAQSNATMGEKHTISMCNNQFLRMDSATEHSFAFCDMAYGDGALLWASRGNLRLLDAESARRTITAVLPCPAIEGAAFQDNLIRTDLADGETRLWRAVGFSCPEPDVAAEAPAAPTLVINEETCERKNDESSGNITTIYWVELRDADGQVLGSAFDDAVERFYNHEEEFTDGFINCVVAPDGRAAYCWGERADETVADYFYRVRVAEDGRSLLPVERIQFPALYRSDIEEIAATAGGCAVTITGNKVLLYADDAMEPYQVVALEHSSGNVEETALSEGGWLAALMHYNDADTYAEIDFLRPDYYVIELWDVATGTHLANLENGRGMDEIYIRDLAFTEDRWLSYTLYESNDERTVNLCLAADAPDADTLDALRSLCCYTLGDDNALTYHIPTFTGNLGAWSETLREE